MPARRKPLKQPDLPRKRPTQTRAQETVDAILAASAHILETRGMDALTTNHVAERAGVSIGSLYQYFPSKEAIVLMLAERHHHKVRAVLMQELGSVSPGNSMSDLREFIARTIDAMVLAHQVDPKLHRALSEGVPKDLAFKTIHESSGPLVRGALELFEPRLLIRDIEAATFLLITTVEAVTHDGAVYAPAMLRASLKQELTDMITRYLLGSETAGERRSAR